MIVAMLDTLRDLGALHCAVDAVHAHVDSIDDNDGMLVLHRLVICARRLGKRVCHGVSHLQVDNRAYFAVWRHCYPHDGACHTV